MNEETPQERLQPGIELLMTALAHEIRGPILQVQGMCEFLGELMVAPHDPERDVLSRLTAAADRLACVAEKILMLAHANHDAFDRLPVDLSECARSALLELRCVEPHREVEAVVEDGLLTTGDPDLLYTVVHCLLCNAWKYTVDRQPAHLHFGRHGGPESDEFCVRDNGPGVPAESLSSLFDPFTSAHRRSSQGVGVGLALSHLIVERHGGTLRVESAPEGGAAFCFTIPKAGQA